LLWFAYLLSKQRLFLQLQICKTQAPTRTSRFASRSQIRAATAAAAYAAGSITKAEIMATQLDEGQLLRMCLCPIGVAVSSRCTPTKSESRNSTQNKWGYIDSHGPSKNQSTFSCPLQPLQPTQMGPTIFLRFAILLCRQAASKSQDQRCRNRAASLRRLVQEQ